MRDFVSKSNEGGFIVLGDKKEDDDYESRAEENQLDSVLKRIKATIEPWPCKTVELIQEVIRF